MTLDEVQFPAAVAGSAWRRYAQVFAGRLLRVFAPAYVRRIAAGDMPPRIGRLERAVIAALVDRHARAGTLDQLAPLHNWLWMGEQAVAFHEHARGRFDGWWLKYHSAIVEPIRQLADAPRSAYRCLCEIGCGSGLILEDLALRLPMLDMLIGIDLSPAQISRNRARAVDSRIRFEAADATTWIPQNGRAGTIYLTVAGVFEYFPRAALQQLFSAMASGQHPAAIALIEPIAADYDFETEEKSRPYGFENSVVHNYPRLLRAAGFEVRFQERQTVDGQMFLLLVAETRP